MIGRSLIAVALLMSATACGRDAPAASGEPADSAGVPVVANPLPGPGTTTIALTDEPLATIGGPGRGPGHELFQVGSGTVLEDGTIVLANGGTVELRFYDRTGAYLRSVGGQGEGPGEFEAVSLVGAFGGDSLMVWDSRQRRFSVLASDGSFARSFRTSSVPGVIPTAIGALSDGRVVLRTRELGVGDPTATTGVERRPSHVVVLDPSGAVERELGSFPGEETSVVIREEGSSSYGVIFGRDVHAAARRDAIAVGNDDAYRIRIYRTDGTLARIVMQTREPRVVQSGDFDRALPEPLRPEAPSTPAKERFEENIERMPRHETFPAFGGSASRALRFDRTGNLWVLEYRTPWDERSSWHVFDPDGVFVGRVDLPEGSAWLDAGGDWILLRLEDELDVETVALFGLRRGAGAGMGAAGTR